MADYSSQYFTIESLENSNTIKFNYNGLYTTFYCSVDDGATWTSFTSTKSISLNAGQKALFRGTKGYIYYDNSQYWYFSSAKTYKVYGNSMSLIYGSSFTDKTTFPSSTSANFKRLFYNSTKLTDASNLVLPATTLTSSCYDSMFYGCTSLTKAPELPATTLASNCYQQMFYGCTSLTEAPVLPATTLQSSCYSSMFYGCTSLTKAHELPATTLATYCYNYMFYGCTSLTKAPELPASILVQGSYSNMFMNCSNLSYIKCLAKNISASNCTSNWVNGVAANGTFVKAQPMTSWTSGTNGIPSGWTREDASETRYFTIESLEDNNTITFTIPSTLTTGNFSYISYSTNGTSWTQTNINGTDKTISVTLNTGDKVYWKGSGSRMYGSSPCKFSGTKNHIVYGNIMSLLYVDEYMGQLTLPAIYTFPFLFAQDTHLTNAENLLLQATTLKNYCYYGMFQDCTSLEGVPSLPAPTLTNGCYKYMFQNCTSMSSAPELPATTLANNCYEYMFQNCTALENAPALPATTLTDYCYQYMFKGCSSLSFIKCFATDISATDCTSDWVDDVADSGVFVKDMNMSDWTTGTSGIPIGWTLIGYIDSDYLAIESLEDNNTITFTIPSALTTSYLSEISYSTDGSNWTTTTVDGTDKTINVTLDTGDKVYWKGLGTSLSSSSSVCCNFSGTKSHVVYGNIMTLLYGSNISGKNALETAGTFRGLFRDDTHLVDAENLTLPATTLKGSCYYNMFYGCTSLEAAPSLPATTMISSCYQNMFRDCSSLVSAPALPATTLAMQCYYNMFNGCTSLTEAPALPATTMANSCYRSMFQNCTSLTTAPELPAPTLTGGNCCSNMFNGCSSLSSIRCLATSVSSGNTASWVSGVAATGTFSKPGSMTSWTIGDNGIPTGWTTQDDGTLIVQGSTPEEIFFMEQDVDKVYYEENLVWWKEHDYSKDFFIIESLEDGNQITFTIPAELSSSNLTDMSYSTNGITWTTTTVDGTSKTISVWLNNRQRVFWKGNGIRMIGDVGDLHKGAKFNGTKRHKVYGNIMSLLYGSNFRGQDTLTGSNAFKCLFYEDAYLASAENLVLPAMTLTEGCYADMFRECSSLIIPPVLPATTLASHCYSHMFLQCTSLTTAPKLPATALAPMCYMHMFMLCTSLTTAPDLPATTLAGACYDGMFWACFMLYIAPDLPATTLVGYCYANMFRECSNLSYIRCLATDISANKCTERWVDNVSATGSFIKSSNMSSWTTGFNGIPTGWGVSSVS